MLQYERVFDESSGVEREVAYKRTELGALEARRQAAEERYMSSLQPGEVLSVGTDKLKALILIHLCSFSLRNLTSH